MGAWLGRRGEPRVDFREAVRVLWPGEVSGVLARAVNLSSSGILVDAPTPTPCPVGSDVLCDVALPRGARLLRGRVAHRRVLPSEKVGMGIEFVDLSPREMAELRDVVGEGAERPQRVKVRFRGTTHVVSARAFKTGDGFRLATTLPFLRPETEVDIALSPDASVSARGWVSLVSLEQASPGGPPRLLIDVRVEGPDLLRDASSDRTPVVEPLIDPLWQPLEAVPEYVWEADEVGAKAESAPFSAPIEIDEEVPTIVSAPRAPLAEEGGAAPSAINDGDHTEIVSFETRGTSRWRALGGGMLAGLVAFGAFATAIVLIKRAAPPPSVLSISPPVIVTENKPAPPPVVAGPSPTAAPLPVPEPPPSPEAVEAPLGAAEGFFVSLEGSLAGAKRYPLRAPDGVAFNLPRARSPMKMGTYAPAVRGLKTVWVRALPGGGTHLRFYYTSARVAPRVVLERDGVRVTAHEP